MGNPFLENSGNMLTLDTKVVMSKYAIQTVNAVEEIGQRQYSECVEDMPKSASNKPLSDLVSNITLALFSIFSSKAEVKKQVTSRIFEDKLYSLLSSLHCLTS